MLDQTKKRKKRLRWDSNPQSPPSEGDALSIRPRGQRGSITTTNVRMTTQNIKTFSAMNAPQRIHTRLPGSTAPAHDQPRRALITRSPLFTLRNVCESAQSRRGCTLGDDASFLLFVPLSFLPYSTKRGCDGALARRDGYGSDDAAMTFYCEGESGGKYPRTTHWLPLQKHGTHVQCRRMDGMDDDSAGGISYYT